jgi:glycosyltransferase 2 family protein
MSRARRVGGLVAGALVVAFLVWGAAGGWSRAASYRWHIDWGLLALAVLVLAGFNLSWGLGYTGLVETLVESHPSRRRVMSVWARSVLGRYVPGNVVMFAGRVVLGREAGVPAQASVAASVYEQLAMLVTAALGATGFLVVADRSGWSPLFWLVVVVPLGIVVLDPAVLPRLATVALARFGRDVGVIPLTRARVSLALSWFALTMALLALGTGLGVRAVASDPVGGVAYVGLGFLLAWVLSMVAFVFPSGLGVREGAFAVVLGRHLPGPAAVSLAAASRLLLTAVEVSVVGILVAIGRRR